MVELLVSIAIIAALVMLLLPAIQSVRESSRITSCQNNLKQISLALLTHESTNRAFPSGGWGHAWVGVPGRASGPKQPGGWIYCLLPYVEETNLHSLGIDQTGTTAVQSYSTRLQTVVRSFVCPSRRAPAAWPVSSLYPYVRTPLPYGNVTSVARADYAINAGTSHVYSFAGPATIKEGDRAEYWRDSPVPVKFSGIAHLNTSVRSKDILDGTSKTYLVGEKNLPSNEYETGTSPGDNESLYAGYCTDLHRFAGMIERQRFALSPLFPPLQDDAPFDPSVPGFIRFGSAHSSGFGMAFCDGSVRFIEYDVDPEVHFRTAHRGDFGRQLGKLDYARPK